MSQPSAQPPQYRLADHVRACRVNDQVILLDLERSKYLGIGHMQQADLARAVTDWPASPDNPAASSPRADLCSYLKPLLDQGLLTDARTSPRTALTLADPTESIDAGRADRTSSGSLDLLTLAWAASTARNWINRCSLADTVGRVRRLRARAHASHEVASKEELHAAVGSYQRLRPFLFTAHDECLRDSLTLIRFLATKRLYPVWAIGVRVRPFAAHSWVQEGGLVLNDLHENVRRYTPILIV